MRLLPLLILMALTPSPELRRASGEGLPSSGVSSLGLTDLTFPGAQAAVRGRAPGPFRVEVLAVLDGDTVEVRFVEGPCGRLPCIGQEVAVRILNIDAPEAHRCRTRGARASGGRSCAACAREHELGRKALQFTAILTDGRAARVRDLRPDKYAGRVVGDLQVLDGGIWLSVGPALVEAGLAVPYDGRAKSKPWCGRKSERVE